MITRTGASPGGHLIRAVAFATIVTLAGTARAAPRERDAHRVQPLDNGRPAELDWEEIRARTAELAGAMERARMATAPHLFSGELDSRVRRARELSGPSRSGLGRLAFPSAPDDARRRRLAEAGALLDDLQRKMQADVAEARRYLLALEERGRPAARLAAAAQRAQLGVREAEAARLARQAAEGLRLAAGGFFSRARLWGRQLAHSDGPTVLADLERRLTAWGAAGETAILGADLSYIEGALRPGPLPSASVTPAYLSGPAVGPTLEDTTQGREVQLAPEIVARAQELRTALAAYEFVKDEFRLEWYFGCLKGSTDTLRERRGNDADLATLLVALLRAQGTPARFVRGTVELSIARVAADMGLLGANDAAALDAGDVVLSAGVRDRALAALAASGVPYETVVVAGRPTAVRFLHTWTEAYVPYADYRGVEASREGRQWIPLDPAFRAGARYAAAAPKLDALAAMNMSAEGIVSGYLAHTGSESPAAFTRQRVEDYLAASRPDLAWTDVLRTVQARAEELPFLPAALPYAVHGVHEELAFLPDEAKHRLRVQVSDGSGIVLDVTIPMYDVVGRRTVLAFDPATEADAIAIADAGGMYQVAAPGIAVVPVLRVAGEARARGTQPLPLASDARWTLELLLPDGSSRRIENRVLAGNVVAIGLGGPLNAYDEARDGAEGGADGPAARFLYGVAADYANSWTAAEEDLASLLQVVPLRPSASLVLVEHRLAVDEVLGVRRRIVWKGLEVDADHRSMTPLELVTGRGRELLRLSGLEGSFQEARVLRSATGEDSVSAVTAIQEAHARGVPVLQLTGANAPDDLATLQTSPEVRREVEDQLARGREVVIPASDLTIRDWSGTGFIARDPATDEGAYLLSGLISGGQTVVSPASWTDQALVERLRDTNIDPTEATSLVARILKANPDETDPVVVGTTVAPRALAVYVTTLAGRPVRGARVVFRAVAGSAPGLAAIPEGPFGDTFTVLTDGQGLARAWARPDTNIAAKAIVRPGVPNDVLLGLNEIMAETDNGRETIALPLPFVVLGKNDVPAKIELPCSMAQQDNYCYRSYPVGMQLGQSLWARVLDQFGNVVPNASLTWKTDPPAGTFLDLALVTDRAPRVLDPKDPAQAVAIQLFTGTDGFVVTDFIPAREGGIDLLASARDQAGQAAEVRARYTIETNAPGAGAYAFRMRGEYAPTFDGVYRNSFQAPVGGQVLRWTGNPDRFWEPLTGDEPGIARIRVSMRVIDESQPQAIQVSSEVVEPRAETIGPGWGWFDDARTAAFWPQYVVDGGNQRNEFAAAVVLADGREVRCEPGYVIPSRSRRASGETFRILPGFEEKPTDEYGYASQSDLAVAFKLKNPAAYPIYARIVQEPSVAGEQIVAVPPPDQVERHPTRPDLIKLMPLATTTLTLPLMGAAHGGVVRAEFDVPEPFALGGTVLLRYGEVRIRVAPPDVAIRTPGGELRAQLTLPVRNFESTVREAGRLTPSTETEPPIVQPAGLEFRVKGQAQVEVTAGGSVVAAASVTADGEGNVIEVANRGDGTSPVLTTASRSLLVQVPPADPTVHEVKVAITDARGITQATLIPFETVVKDIGALPIGHTFVRDVSVVDGHLVKQFSDISVKGRGPGLTFARTYSSRDFEVTPLGAGWTHSYRSWAQLDMGAGKRRWIVYGGEGTGQVFDCTSGTCRNQRGFHGTLREETTGSVVYTSRAGTEYRYRRYDAASIATRYWLTEIADPVGNTVTLQYGTQGSGGEVTRVYEPGNRRVLELSYACAAGADHPQLAKLELRSNPTASTAPDAELAPIDQDGVCIAFGYDDRQNLASVERHRDGCKGEPLRVERFEYVLDGPVATRNNLRSYTDPNGHVTAYTWYRDGDTIEGESQFLVVGDQVERVKTVVEPAPGGTTLFEYVLVPKREALLGDTQLLYKTNVTGPRSGTSTVYHLDGYGASARVERALSPATKAISSTRWDPKDVVPVATEDARGRATTLRYDERGNMVERRTSTPVLFDTNGASATEPLVDGDGNLVAEVIERFGYDAEFGGETCRVDAEGRVTTSRYEEGLLVERHAYATVASQASIQAAQTCDDVAAGVSTSQRDQVTVQLYCGVNATCTAAGSLAGDLVKTTTGTRQADVVAYDSYGYAREQRVLVDAGHTIDAISEHDARGRVSFERDDLGHETERWFDDLDRPRAIERRDGRDETPDEYRTFVYYPAGELREEKLGIRADPGSILQRTVTLNGLNKPETVTETGAHVESQVTSATYDAAGNPETATDRRGVRKTTVYDVADRPQQVYVDIADAERFGVNGGDTAGLAARRLVSTFEYDAAGNKVAETDLHGHRTEYALDPLYRVVQTKGPSVPGPDIGGPSVTYKTARRYDRVGNKAYEQDGNGHVTRWSYDFANRVLEAIDAVGRFQRNAFDANGDLEAETLGVRAAPGGPETVHLVRTSKGHDGLGRSLGVQEELSDIDGAKRSLGTSLAYDDVAHTIEERDRRGAVTVRRLDGLDRVYEEVVDAATTSRLSRALAASAGPALALSTAYEYDAGGRRTAVVDPLGHRTEEHFDGLGRVFERRRPMAVLEQFAYDGDGRVISAWDGRGIERRTRYDAFGRATEETLVESVTSGGRPLVTARRTYVDLPEDTQVQEQDALFHQTTRHLDGLHREWKTELTGVPAVETRYDAVNKRAVRDPKGYVTDWVYDEANRVRAQGDLGLDGARRYGQSWEYDDAARTETWRDRRLMPTVTTRDGLARVRTVVRNGGGDVEATERTYYDENGNVVRVEDPNVHATVSSYDGANRKRSEIRAFGTSVAATTTFTYDAAGSRLTTKGPRGDWAFDVRETYDDLNRPVRTEVPTGKPEQPYAVTSRAFDATGNKLCEKRPLGGDPLAAGVAGKTVEDIRAAACGGDQVTRFTYDELSKLTSVVDANGGEHSFVYDGVRNLRAKQDANENLTTYGYDSLNRRTDEWQHLDAHARIRSRDAVPDGAAEGPASPATEVGALHWHVDFDANGNPERRTDPKNVTVVSTYGVLNRLETETYPEPGLVVAYPYPLSTAYAYDGNGNVERVTERKQVSADATAEEVTDPEYDGLGRMKSEQRYDGKVVRYEYDAKGNRKKVTDPDDVATEYGYDAQDRLETATTPAGTASYRYWPDGLLKGRSAPGLEEARCYDPAGQVVAIVTAKGSIAEICPDVGQMVSRFDYGYDVNGNRASQRERRTAPGSLQIGASEETRYGYDAGDRLVGVAYPDGKTTLYQLDGVGNRIRERVAPTAGVLAITVAAFMAALPADLSSDLTATFNRADWLVQQTDAKEASRDASYGYDLAGNLTDKVKGSLHRRLRWSYRGTLTAVLDDVGAGPVEVGRYDYDADLQRVKRTTAAERVEYVLDDRHVLQEADGSSPAHPSTRRYHYGKEPLAVVDAAQRFISTDALGSATDLTNAAGAVSSMRKYDAWGQYRNDTAPTASEPKLGFTGHQYDPETGLVYARARYYDPDLGRFISRDIYEGELGDAPSLHRYSYAYGNPLAYVDLDGNAAADAAEAWERAQREAAWTGEQTMEKVQADSSRFANWAAAKLGDNWFSNSVGALAVSAVQTVIELTGGLGAAVSDPTMLVRAPLRIGTGAAEGVEKIQRGKYLEGALSIVADAATAVETGVGSYAFARGIRVTVEEPRVQSRGVLDLVEQKQSGANGLGAGTQSPAFASRMPEAIPGAPRSWTDLLPQAEERLAQARANYGEYGLQMNAEAPRRVFYVDEKGVAIPAQPGSVFRGTAVSPTMDEAISQSGFLTGRARGVQGNALPSTAPLADRIAQYVEGSPFPRDTDFVGLKRYPHDALNTAARTGRAQLRDPSAYLRLDEVDVSGLGAIDVEQVYSDLGRRPRPPLDVVGELVVEGSVPASRIRKTYRVRPPSR